MTPDEIRARAKALEPEDRFIDVSWAEYHAFVSKDMESLYGYGVQFRCDGTKGYRVGDHVYLRAREMTAPTDPALVEMVNDLTAKTNELLREFEARNRLAPPSTPPERPRRFWEGNRRP